MTAAGGGRVAVVGTGRMGAAMVGRLRHAGSDVTIFNRSMEKAEHVAAETGAVVADSAREAVAAADVVIVSLADDKAVTTTYDGADGLAAGLRAGAVVADTSTVDPQTCAAVRPLVEDRGAELLDTPVSGSVSLVESGQLTIMVGGDPDALERARPALESFASKIFHLGGHGTGATMKLAVNAVLAGLNLALAESLVLAEKAGIDRAKAYDVFEASAVAAPFVHYKREAFVNPDDATVAFSIALAAKDLDLINALAQRSGARMDQAATNRRVAADAIAASYGARDLSAIAAYLRTQS